MESKKLTKDILNQLRKEEGVPIGSEQDIISLSSPPFFTLYPNPWFDLFIRNNGKKYDILKDNYHREPFVFDVSEGKSDPIYMAHTYHTKVPPKAIMNYILHYTNPGDIIYDGFCGTGMSGVACQLCAIKTKVEELGYLIKDDDVYDKKGKLFSKIGLRNAILNDLSPIASFIAYNYNTQINLDEFIKEANQIISKVENEKGGFYYTQHSIDGKIKYQNLLDNKKIAPIMGVINYIIWSDIFICPYCQKEITYWDIALNLPQFKLNDNLFCSYCHAKIEKKDLEHCWITKYDEGIKKTIKQTKKIPVLINYFIEEKKGTKIKYLTFEKKPDENDLQIIDQIDQSPISIPYPTITLIDGEKTKEPKRIGITNIHQFYTKRNLFIIALLLNEAKKSKYYHQFLFLITSFVVKTGSNLHNIGFKKNRINLAGALPNTLYNPSLFAERNIFELARNKIDDIKAAFSFQKKTESVITGCSSSTKINIPDDSIDYIFIDPPFGQNLMYSELNFIWESWLNVFTNNKNEAIINPTQGKHLKEYQKLMELCFKENNRILKPNRWMTVEFHNTKNSVWNAIQEAIQNAGFIIADVRILDKQQGTFNVQTSESAVDKDLAISTYKPKSSFIKKFSSDAQNITSVWDFIEEHLDHLPIFVEKDNKLEIIGERQKYLLYDRMIAYYISHGFKVPISSNDFFAQLQEKFPEREGMYFLPSQVNDFDKKKMTVKEFVQLQLFVTDEKSAIIWLKNYLKQNPSTYQEIQPQFLKQMLSVEKYENMPELMELLEQNFLKSENTGKWQIPDPNKESDLEKLRQKHLLKEFKAYLEEKKKLKQFRIEAIKAGFKDAWDRKDFDLIIIMSEKIPEQVVQEDPMLLMYYDNALMMKPKSV